ncbi:hypothetical protein M5689_009510 [Euphorbia peplus]|nr:hypothetical protein M5689_009510 [Euphorbia peplus]
MEEVRNPPSRFEVSSFDKLVQEIRQMLGATGSPYEVTNLLQARVIPGFVNQVLKDSIRIKLDENKQEEEEETLKKTNPSSSCVIDDKEKQETCKATSRSSSSCNVEHQRNKTSKLKSGGKKSKSKNTSNIRGRTVRVGFHDKMSSRMKERIEEKGGSDMKLVIVKKMYETDLSEHHDRLSIPVKQIKDTSFLTEVENWILDNDGELDVKLMEPCEETSNMVLVKWRLKTTKSLALRTSWKAVLGRNHGKHFKKNDVIQLWSFRVRGELWLAIDKIWDAPSVSCMKDGELETDTESETGKTTAGTQRKRETANEEKLSCKIYRQG